MINSDWLPQFSASDDGGDGGDIGDGGGAVVVEGSIKGMLLCGKGASTTALVSCCAALSEFMSVFVITAT